MIQKLGQICDFHSGNAWKASKFKDEGIPIIRINNMKPNATDFKYWDWEEPYDPKYFVEEGDILVSLSGTIKTYKWIGEKALLNQRIVRVTAKDNINIDWVYYQLSNVIERISDKGKDAVIKNVSVTDLKKYEVDVPDLPTQNKIVALLDKANALVQKREESIALLDELLRAQFLTMFGKANDQFDVWEDVQIKSLALERKNSMRTGPFGSNLKHSEFVENGPVAVLGIDNAVKNTFEWKERRYITIEKYEDLKRYTVLPRDVIITIMGTVGRSAVIPEDIPTAINTKHLACISLDPKKCNPYYLAYSIHSNPYISFQMKAREKGAIMAGLNLTIIKDLKLKDVPIELQNKFEDIYHSIQTQKENLTQFKTDLENLYNSLLQDAFKGEIDLKEEVKKKELIMPELKKKEGEKVDITKIDLATYWGITEDVMRDYPNWMFDLTGEDSFYQFLLKDTYTREDSFTLQDIEVNLHGFYYHDGDIDFDNAQWQQIIFKFLEAKPPLLEQIFEEETGTVKLKLTDETFKA